MVAALLDFLICIHLHCFLLWLLIPFLHFIVLSPTVPPILHDSPPCLLSYRSRSIPPLLLCHLLSRSPLLSHSFPCSCYDRGGFPGDTLDRICKYGVSDRAPKPFGGCRSRCQDLIGDPPTSLSMPTRPTGRVCDVLGVRQGRSREDRERSREEQR